MLGTFFNYSSFLHVLPWLLTVPGRVCHPFSFGPEVVTIDPFFHASTT
jgi:hypothetical protein